MVPVVPAGRAVARRGTRHGQDLAVPALVQGRQAGHLDRLAPAAVPLDGHEPLLMAAAVPEEPAGRAAARRGARHRADAGVPALVQGRQAGHRDRPAPPARRPDGRSRGGDRGRAGHRSRRGRSCLRAPGYPAARPHPPRTPEPGVASSRPSNYRRCFMSMTGAGTRQSPPHAIDAPRAHSVHPPAAPAACHSAHRAQADSNQATTALTHPSSHIGSGASVPGIVITFHD